MITLVVKGSFEKALQLIKKTSLFVDVYEYRLDLMKDVSLKQLKELIKASKKASILTLRMKAHGGAFQGDFDQKWRELQTYLLANPSYVDFEVGTPFEYFNEIKKLYPKTKIIYSFHDFKKTPNNLSKIAAFMHHSYVDELKIAVFAKKLTDVAKIFNLSKRLKKQNCKFTLICLGQRGQLTRSLAGYLGCSFWYCKDVDDPEDFLGQHHYRDLLELYRIRSQSENTKLFSLIGTPVFQSPSHITHNYTFKLMNLDAVYVKIEVMPDEIHWFFTSQFKNLFSGFSVTAPFKEVAFSCFSTHSKEVKKIGAANTVFKKGNRWRIKNTDSCGIGDAIESHINLNGKTCAVIGAGGSARATIYELIKRGAFVLIFNRTDQKREILSKHFNIRSYPLNQIGEFIKEIDVLINTTSAGMPPLFDLPIPKSAFPKAKHVMDLILFPKETLFLRIAKECENKIIFGIEMFYKQAILQFKSWFENIDENQAFLNLTKAEKNHKLDLLNLFNGK